MSEIKLAIFASGSGTNAENIIRYFRNHPLIRVVLVACNNPEAYVIRRAEKLDVPCYLFGKKEMYQSTQLLETLHKYGVDFIILAGFLWLIPENILKEFQGRILNIHPALLPAYGGKGMYGDRVHKAVLENRERVTGITIHLVNENYDEGEIIFQEKCNIDPDRDSVDDIAAKVHKLEYRYYPWIIEMYIQNTLK